MIEYGAGTNLEDELKIEAYAKGKDKNKTQKEKIIVKYYVEDHGQRFYYEQSGNDKVAQAEANGDDEVILNNDDLKIAHISHTFDPTNMVIIHNQSAKTFPVKIRGNIV